MLLIFRLPKTAKRLNWQIKRQNYAEAAAAKGTQVRADRLIGRNELQVCVKVDGGAKAGQPRPLGDWGEQTETDQIKQAGGKKT